MLFCHHEYYLPGATHQVIDGRNCNLPSLGDCVTIAFSSHSREGGNPELINTTRFRIALRLPGTGDLKGYDKKSNCDTVSKGW